MSAPRGGPLTGARGPPAAPPARKLTIKPLKAAPTLPDDFEAATWARLLAAVDAVFAKQPAAASFEDLYRDVDAMCLHGMADRLYDRLRGAWDAHLGGRLAALAARAAPDAAAFLPQFDAAWTDHVAASRTLRQVFAPLDAAVAAAAAAAPRGGGAAARPPLHDLGIALFVGHLSAHPALEARAGEGLLHAVATERRGGVTDRGLAASAARGLVALGLYARVFEAPFLAATDAFYAEEGARLIGDLAPADYLLHAERRLSEEGDRCAALLDAPRTRRPLVATVDARLLAAHIPSLLDRGLGPLFDARRVPDLARLHAACARVGALDALRAAFKGHVRDRGGALVAAACGAPCDGPVDAPASPPPGDAAAAAAADRAARDMVPSLLALKAAADTAVDAAFAGGRSFSTAVKEAFESVLNRHGARPAELLAKHVDAELRGGAGAGTAAGAAATTPGGGGGGDAPTPAPTRGRASGDELDARLDAALALFRYVDGKDVFEAFYKKDLAKRLLLGRSASLDAEKRVLGKLKVECGPAFTAKLEGMFVDMDVSRDVMAGFRAAAGGAALPAGLDVSVSVLTAGYWPTYDAGGDVKLPPELASAAAAFESHYLGRHGGRRLAWRHALSTAVVRARFDRGAKDLVVSLAQAAVLLLFNGDDGAAALSVADVAAGAGLPTGDARRVLASLACGRAKILLKAPPGKDVGPDDTFTINAGFTSPLFRVRVNGPQLRDSPADAARTTAAVAQDRAHAVDAAIVRIMKTRKTLAHRLLASELAAQLRFPVRAADLKKRVESLIDREFLARDADDPSVYNYLA